MYAAAIESTLTGVASIETTEGIRFIIRCENMAVTCVW